MATTERRYEYDSRVNSIHIARVNRASLQAEAKIIRREEKRAGIPYRYGLYLHRVGRLREEARIANVAFAYLRGRRYEQVERKSGDVPLTSDICNKLSRWGVRSNGGDVDKWLRARG